MELTRYNEAHCHKWAVLLEKRRRKMEQAIAAIHSGNFETAQMFVFEIFHGEESQVLTPSMIKKLKTLGPKARVIDVEGIGHYPALSDEDQIEFVCRFLENTARVPCP